MRMVTLKNGVQLPQPIFDSVTDQLLTLYKQSENVPFYELFRLCTIDGYEVADPNIRTALLDSGLVSSFNKHGEALIPYGVQEIVRVAVITDPTKPNDLLLGNPKK